MISNDTIAAIATAAGVGAIGVIRLSGPQAFSITQSFFKGKDLTLQKSHTIHFGTLTNKEGEIVDEVVVSLFKGPKSYTGEDTVEISGHGSPFILQNILNLCLENGARIALPGEFTQRAFLNGKVDLAQAEAVADLIAADTKAMQQAAMHQLRGGFSGDLKQLREELINFAALIELELDFSDEDVEFADREQLQKLISTLSNKTGQLINSFQLGNVVKKGVSVALIGKPNVGKSTLLNALLNEERAIVSDIAGTTRDTIEESLNINGVAFRLIDTAGIREHTADVIEQIGVGRSLEKMKEADIVIALFDAELSTEEEVKAMQEDLIQQDLKFMLVLNKMDKFSKEELKSRFSSIQDLNLISAKHKLSIDHLKQSLYDRVVGGEINTENTIVTNARHHAALLKVQESLDAIQQGMDAEITGDLLAIDIKRCLYFLGEITGQIDIDQDILGTIFGKFCIGK